MRLTPRFHLYPAGFNPETAETSLFVTAPAGATMKCARLAPRFPKKAWRDTTLPHSAFTHTPVQRYIKNI